MSQVELEQTLQQLARVGTLVAKEPDRQIWRFNHGGRPYTLYFYPGSRSRVRGGSEALRLFNGLTALQRLNVPVVRAIAMLSGFRLESDGESLSGDAVVLDLPLSAVPLHQYLAGFDERGEAIPDRRDLALQIRTAVHNMGRGNLGHRRLGLDCFVIDGRQLLFLGGQGIRSGGLLLKDVLRLGYTAARYATTSELLRGWETLGPGADMPLRNSVAEGIWQSMLRESLRESEHFGELSGQQFGNGWSGIFTKRADVMRRWATASRIVSSHEDWQRVWPALLEQIENDQLEIIKRGDSGDVLAGEVVLAGRPVAIVVKRPRRKSLRQYVFDVWRGSRARRTWIKTWKMTVRDVPCEWPMLLMEKRSLGYVTDAVLVFGRVDGPTLAEVQLSHMPEEKRNRLFLRAGRTLRRIESLGFTHMDAKSTNWIVFDDGKPDGPIPVLVDVDGVRHYRWATAGILRLLRAMKQHSEYTPADSLNLCRGYAPRAEFTVE